MTHDMTTMNTYQIQSEQESNDCEDSTKKTTQCVKADLWPNQKRVTVNAVFSNDVKNLKRNINSRFRHNFQSLLHSSG